jgi:hypothetical protein
MLLYSLLHLTGYDVSLDDLEHFRQWGSRTPGHPEYGLTPGVEATTGPLGQGFANGVGMAIAERRLAAEFDRPGHTNVDLRVFGICPTETPEGIARRPRAWPAISGSPQPVYPTTTTTSSSMAHVDGLGRGRPRALRRVSLATSGSDGTDIVASRGGHRGRHCDERLSTARSDPSAGGSPNKHDL